MKDLIRGIVTSVAALIVFTFVIVVGVIFNLIYPIYMSFKEKDPLLFFKIWWRLIDGTLSSIGNILYEGIAINWDILGNVWGEWIEDSVTTTEHSKFGEKNITISAAIGYLEYENLPIFKRGKTLSKVLNFVFREKKHALGSWKKKLAYDEIKEQDLKEKIK